MSKRVKISLFSVLAFVVALSGWGYLSLFGNPIKMNDAASVTFADQSTSNPR